MYTIEEKVLDELIEAMSACWMKIEQSPLIRAAVSAQSEVERVRKALEALRKQVEKPPDKPVTEKNPD